MTSSPLCRYISFGCHLNILLYGWCRNEKKKMERKTDEKILAKFCLLKKKRTSAEYGKKFYVISTVLFGDSVPRDDEERFRKINVKYCASDQNILCTHPTCVFYSNFFPNFFFQRLWMKYKRGNYVIFFISVVLRLCGERLLSEFSITVLIFYVLNLRRYLVSWTPTSARNFVFFQFY